MSEQRNAARAHPGRTLRVGAAAGRAPLALHQQEVPQEVPLGLIQPPA
jgi:hypothetical protein